MALASLCLGCGAEPGELPPTEPPPVEPAGAEATLDPLVARTDPALRARLTRCEPMVYAEPPGADEADRGPHVRAASGLARLGAGLLIAQDDMSFLAIREPDGRLSTRALPARDGHRSFDAERGNVHRKPDLEACTSLPDGRALCFGSGTMAERAWIAIVDPSLEVSWSDAEPFYASLRRPAFCGPELNLEGAVVVGDRLRLFHRGNGAGAGRSSAFVDLELRAFLRWLEAGGPLPEPLQMRAVNLGSAQGVAFGFTAATAARGGAVLFLAGAEASPSVLEDGRVVGVRIGVMDETGVRLTAIEGADGAPTAIKLEGLVLDLDDPARAWAVSDVDATAVPASLCEIELIGPWTGAPGS